MIIVQILRDYTGKYDSGGVYSCYLGESPKHRKKSTMAETMNQDNPLLQNPELPDFAAIKVEHIEPAIDQLLSNARVALETQLEHMEEPSWEALIEPIEQRDDEINKSWSPVSHLNSVKNSEELRLAYNACIAKLSQYSTEMGQNQSLYQHYQRLAESSDFGSLSQAKQQHINNALRDFRLAGVALNETEKARFSEIKQRLSTLSTQFSNNVLDATQAWYKVFSESEPLAGLPDNALAIAKVEAESKQQAGYVITLDAPCYIAIMQYVDDRNLREEVYRAYVSRASEASYRLEQDQGPWDNAPLIDEILSLRHELSSLLGFPNYAELSLVKKMADSTEQVIGFLEELAAKSRPIAEQELLELQAYAKSCGLNSELKPWDLAYYSEKLKTEKYDVSEQQLRQYFPAKKVCEGLFEVAKKLFNIEVIAAKTQVWHEDVEFFHVQRNGEIIAKFYLDLYARSHKRGGAWMDECRVRRLTGQSLQLPVAYLTCNFSPPVDGKPSLLNHNEVTTLFHEFGHGLHHMLTQIDVAAVSGINGVAWDAVELPSQFLENWCWQEDVIPMISGHYETHEPLPKDMLDKLLAAKNFQSAMQMLRQIEFSLFDFELHKTYQEHQPVGVQTVLDGIREKISVLIPPDFNKFQNSFSHIFAGGYAAGYYSYKWAEVLSADAFSRFEEEGIFSIKAGNDFLNCILEQGGSQDAMTLYTLFRGREPNTEALLRHSGI